jgi:hypothetical protein
MSEFWCSRVKIQSFWVLMLVFDVSNQLIEMFTLLVFVMQRFFDEDARAGSSSSLQACGLR